MAHVLGRMVILGLAMVMLTGPAGLAADAELLAPGTKLGASAAPTVSGDYTLVWSDEFDGTAVDPNNWEFMIGNGSDYGVPGWGNNELEYYTSRPANAYVSGGTLHIVARRENYAGYEYTSARLRSANRQEFRYGRIVARMILPSGQGIWPALWMLPTSSPYGGWAASGEIDIMESINTANRVYGTIHYGGGWPNNTSSGGSFADGTNYSQGFHEYALEWEPDVMRWYVDDQLFYSVSSSTWYSSAAPSNPRAPFDVPFHFLVNVAVGGTWPGAPSPSTPFPLQLVVDWLRVYELTPPAPGPYYGTPQTIPGRIEAETYDTGGEGVAYHDCEATNHGGAFRPAEGVDLENCSEGTVNVGWMCSGEWFNITLDAPFAGPFDVRSRVASQATGGSFRLESDGVDVSGPIAVPVTGGWQSWTNVWSRVVLPKGERTLRFQNTASGEYNVNYFHFYSAADFDRDDDVDAGDHGVLCAALAGPDVLTPPAGVPTDQFMRADLDGDGDVDLGDFTLLHVAGGS